MSSAKKFLVKLLGPLILSKSKIVSNERISPHFQFLTIQGKSLRKAEWIPGQKIQIQLKNDDMRSYTPSSWDSSKGVMQTLVYMHGKGPGALWARDAAPASKVTVIGPRKSLKLDPEDKNIIFFGDETTFGLAHALKKYTEDIRYSFLFEANDLSESKSVLERFELGDSPLYKLNQYEIVSKEIVELFNKNKQTRIILSGKQQSIVKVREYLYESGIPKDNIDKKVYWGWKDDPNGKLKK